MLTPLVSLATVGFLSVVYKFVEIREVANKPETYHVTFNGQQHRGILHRAAGVKESEEFLYQWAILFCSEKGPAYGFDIATFNNCTQPLMAALRSRQKVVRDADIVSYVSLNALPPLVSSAGATTPEESTETVNESNDNIAATAEQTAESELPASQASSGVTTEAESTNENEIATEDSTPPAVLTHKLPLEINGITYVFEYIVTYDILERSTIANKLAVSFCDLHGEQLVDQARLSHIMQARRNQGEQNVNQSEVISNLLKTDCVEPISGALVANMKFPSDF